MKDEDDKPYDITDAIAEEATCEIDYRIISAMMNALGDEYKEGSREDYEENMRKRIAAKIGSRRGDMVVWDEVAE